MDPLPLPKLARTGQLFSQHRTDQVLELGALPVFELDEGTVEQRGYERVKGLEAIKWRERAYQHPMVTMAMSVPFDDQPERVLQALEVDPMLSALHCGVRDDHRAPGLSSMMSWIRTILKRLAWGSPRLMVTHSSWLASGSPMTV